MKKRNAKRHREHAHTMRFVAIVFWVFGALLFACQALFAFSNFKSSERVHLPLGFLLLSLVCFSTAVWATVECWRGKG